MSADTSALKQLIKDFDGSTEAATRLKEATKEVKDATDAQRKAITAVNGATRIQNFQTIENLRLIRSTASLFSNLNQVYQSVLLRQIASTQATVAQQQAFEGVIRFAGNYVNALGILGPANEDVKAGLDDLIARADSLDSKNIQILIDAYIKAGEEAGLSGEKLESFNSGLAILNKLLDETKLEERNKAFNDFFQSFGLATIAGVQVAKFVLELQKLERVKKLLLSGSNAAKGAGGGVPGSGASAALGILAIPGILEALGLEPNTTSPITGGKIKVVNPFKQLDQLTTAVSKNEININNPTFNSEMDLEKTIDIIKAKLLEDEGKGTLQ